MKTYTIVVRMNDDTVDNIMDFISNEFTEAEIMCLYEDGRNCRLSITVDDDFDYGYLEDCLDSNGNKCEFLDVEKDKEALEEYIKLLEFMGAEYREVV